MNGEVCKYKVMVQSGRVCDTHSGLGDVRELTCKMDEVQECRDSMHAGR